MPSSKDAIWSAIGRTELKQYLNNDVVDEKSTLKESSLSYKTLYEFLNTYNPSYTEGYMFINDEGEVYDVSIRNIILPLDFDPFDSSNELRNRFILNIEAINDFISISKESEHIESNLKNHSLILKSHFD